jgi:hypothetical protein
MSVGRVGSASSQGMLPQGNVLVKDRFGNLGRTLTAECEERFIAQKARDGAEYLSARADAFAQKRTRRRASARSARNDKSGYSVEKFTLIGRGVRIGG